VRSTPLASLLLLLAGCSSGGPPGTAPAPGPAPRPNIDPGRIEPAPINPVAYPRTGTGIWRYQMSRRDSIVATMPTGEDQVTVLGRTAFLTLTWIAADTGTRLTATVDSVLADTTVPTPRELLDSAVSSRWTALRLPSGRLTPLQGGVHSLISDQIRDQLALLFPLFPPAGIHVGDSWSDTTTTPTRVSFFEATEQGYSSYTAEAATDGMALLSITAVRERSAAGEGSQFGQPISVNATGEDTLRYSLGANAVVLSVSGWRHTSLVVQLPSIGQTVPAQEISLLEMRLLR